MGLREQIKKEEEELKKLETGEQDDGEGDQDDTDSDTDTDEGDVKADAEGDQDDAGADDEPKGGKKQAAKTDKPAKKADAAKKAADKDADAEGDDDSDAEDDEKGKNPNNLAAKLRIERKERMRLQEENERLRKTSQPQTAQHPPVKGQQQEGEGKPAETVEQRLDRMENEKAAQDLRTQAIDEFNSIETEYSKANPDYEAASQHVIRSMYGGVKAAYPHLTDKQALGFVQNRILQIASDAANRGLNPVEYLHQMAFDNYGFDPSKAAQNGAPKKTGKADNLKKIDQNRKRSASPLAGGGQAASSNVSIKEAEDMDLATFGQMSETEIDALIQQAGQ